MQPIVSANCVAGRLSSPQSSLGELFALALFVLLVFFTALAAVFAMVFAAAFAAVFAGAAALVAFFAAAFAFFSGFAISATGAGFAACLPKGLPNRPRRTGA